MRAIVIIMILWGAAVEACSAQEINFLVYDYSEVGLTFMVPAEWEHDGLTTTTKAEFIKHFGWVYDEPDANDLWSAYGSFSSVAVDSTRLPSDASLTIHTMKVFVNRAHTFYKRWLCLYRKNNILESKPLVNEGYALVQEKRMAPLELPPNLSDAKGISYQYHSRQVNLPTYGHVYTFVHQDKCYEIRLESTSANPIWSNRLHGHIVSSMDRFSF